MLADRKIYVTISGKDTVIQNSELFVYFHAKFLVYFFQPVLLTVDLTCLVSLTVHNCCKWYIKVSLETFP